MMLAIDIGNTTVTFGVFGRKKLLSVKRIPTKKFVCHSRKSGNSDLKNIVKHWIPAFAGMMSGSHQSIDGICIVSVVPKLDNVFKKACKELFGITPLFATYRTIGMPIKNYPKKQIGADRLVGAFAAYKIYKKPAIVIDAGTAITFDCVSKKGEFVGGAIAPGLGLQAKALYEMTAKLPLVSNIKKPSRAIGNSTRKCIESGIYFGVCGLINVAVDKFSREMKTKPVVIATGGNAELISKGSNAITHTHPNLILEGLRLLYLDFLYKI